MRINFLEQHKLDGLSIELLRSGVTGVYFIFLEDVRIVYPFGPSCLIYIGMSESAQNSVANRLRGHLTGQSGNIGIANYAKRHQVAFTHHSMEVLSALGSRDAAESESFFLSDFARVHGSFPICNGQSGREFPNTVLSQENITVQWEDLS